MTIANHSEPVLRSDDPRGVVTLTLNRPAQFNAMSQAVLGALQAHLDDLAHDNNLRAVVLAANGKAFCAGHDLAEIMALPGRDAYLALFEQCSRVMLGLRNLPVPVIAKVQGLATAAGCQLVAQCDLAVATQQARFAVSGINLGLFCATPSVPLVRAVSSKFAMEMLVTGKFIDAQQALAQGLLNRVVDAEQLDSAVEVLLVELLGKPREALAMGKALVYRQRELDLESAYALAAQTMADNMALDCAQEGVRAFLEKRAPRWRAMP